MVLSGLLYTVLNLWLLEITRQNRERLRQRFAWYKSMIHGFRIAETAVVSFSWFGKTVNSAELPQGAYALLGQDHRPPRRIIPKGLVLWVVIPEKVAGCFYEITFRRIGVPPDHAGLLGSGRLGALLHRFPTNRIQV